MEDKEGSNEWISEGEREIVMSFGWKASGGGGSGGGGGGLEAMAGAADEVAGSTRAGTVLRINLISAEIHHYGG